MKQEGFNFVHFKSTLERTLAWVHSEGVGRSALFVLTTIAVCTASTSVTAHDKCGRTCTKGKAYERMPKNAKAQTCEEAGLNSQD